jgi:glycosyltransferase involved in cell wall biosynthesis
MTPCPADNFNPVVVTPTYNNQRTLGDILSRIERLGLPIIVVNDGCTDETPRLLEDWRRENPRTNCRIVTHPQNSGKAAALQSGFEAAIAAGFTHAISIDTDGQHDPEEIPVLLEASRQNPPAYVLGYRDDTAADYPAKSRIGRRLSNFFIRLECGARIIDSQCGMRVYPLELVKSVRCRAGHFGYEAEIITRAAWAGCPIAQVPIVTRYLPAGQRVSHFRPWLDTVRGIGTHIRLLGRAMMPWPHSLYATTESAGEKQSLARSIWRWISPLHAWRELREGTLAPTEISAALAAGVFIGNLPTYGLQTAISLYTAKRLHLHPLAVVTGSHISIPPIAPFLIAGAIEIGHLVLHGSFFAWPGMSAMRAGWKSLVGQFLADWLVGSVLLGAVLAIFTFVLSQAVIAASRRLSARSRATDASVFSTSSDEEANEGARLVATADTE